MSRIKRGLMIGVLGGLGLVAGCGPADGLQSFTFALRPVAELTLAGLPEAGLDLRPIDFAATEGRVVGAPPAGTLAVTIEALPPLGTTADQAFYRLRMVLADPAPGTAIEIGRVEASPLGRAEVAIGRAEFALASATGAHLELVLPGPPGGQESTYEILQGELGNLTEDGTQATAPKEPSGGHQH